MNTEQTTTTADSVARLAVRALQDEGVEVVFGIPGVHNQGLYDSLVDCDSIRSVVTRHEQGAAFMADGYARVSGNAGLCFVITGAGLTNAATALAEAYADSVPVVCVVTRYAAPASPSRRLHDLRDQSLVIAGICKESFVVNESRQVGNTLRRAFRAAVSGRPGPVAVEIPLEFLDMTVESQPSPAGSQSVPARDARPGPVAADTRTALAAALNAIRVGKAPVIVIGGGASGSPESVAQLAERLQAPVLCTTAAKGILPPDHPMLVGPWLKSNKAHELLGKADPLVLLGTEWSTTDLGEAPFSLPATVVRVDIDDAIRPLQASDIGVLADVGEAIAAWLPSLDQRGADDASTRVAELRKAAEAEPRRWSVEAKEYLRRMRDVLDSDAILVHDMNTLSYAAVEHYPSSKPGCFLFPRGYGTLGYALPAAIGARFAAPTRQVVAVCGDGGFLFTSEELATAVRYRLNLPVIVWNNQSYGAIRATRTAAYGRSVDDDLINPDFVRLAEAYGAAGTLVRSPADLSAALAAALARPTPTVIEIDAPL